MHATRLMCVAIGMAKFCRLMSQDHWETEMSVEDSFEFLLDRECLREMFRPRMILMEMTTVQLRTFMINKNYFPGRAKDTWKFTIVDPDLARSKMFHTSYVPKPIDRLAAKVS